MLLFRELWQSLELADKAILVYMPLATLATVTFILATM